MSAPSRPPQTAPPPPGWWQVVRPAELGEADVAAWRRLHRERPELASPYFHPTFVRLVAAARAAHSRDDVRVGVLREEASGEPIAFLPFQRGRWGRATPPGGRLCDFHGLIAPADTRTTAVDALRGCGLRSYAFHMLPPGQPAFAAAGDRTEAGWERGGVRVNLAGGFDAYLARREAEGSKRHRKIAQFRRRMERERGEVTFTWQDTDPEAWERLLRWKRGQYAATGFCDVLAAPWVRDLLARCRDADAADEHGFEGVFCTLRAGGAVVAGHLLLRSGPRLHAWFPAYDAAARALSPGNVLMLELLRHAADRGVTALDLGAGDEPYKSDYATDRFALLRGVAETPGAATHAVASARRVRDALKAHPAGAPARLAAAWVRPLRERHALR
ncbi:GNAT family N-acetyltransferase [Alienimonas sp. DA493]|uniref:GNAT family N-acetyltransferase n=1 Tax=Alienimonas sp. DA493 TaxID=3373605 RepID=UPI0037551586